jgi:hypothetical protein
VVTSVIVTEALQNSASSPTASMRSTASNVFNHAQFTTAQGNFASNQFGQGTAASAARIGQVSAKFLF